MFQYLLVYVLIAQATFSESALSQENVPEPSQKVYASTKSDSLLLTEIPQAVATWTNRCENKERAKAADTHLCRREAAAAIGRYRSGISSSLVEQVKQLQSAWLIRVAELSSPPALSGLPSVEQRHLGQLVPRRNLQSGIQTAEQALTAAGLQSALAVAAVAESSWLHNGSIVQLHGDGVERVFEYLQPRRGLQTIGVGKGTMLFKGRQNGLRLSGTAYLFSATCGAVGYRVEGALSQDGQTIELSGSAPKRNAKCQIIDHRPDMLVFRAQRSFIRRFRIMGRH
jgi:hypothetical protein